MVRKGKIVTLKTTKKPYAVVPPGKGKIRMFSSLSAARKYASGKSRKRVTRTK